MSIFSRRQRIITLVLIGFLALGGAGFFYNRYTHVSVPVRFTEARLQGAIISESIVGLSNQLSNDVARINTLDDQGRYNEALELADTLLAESQDVRVKANQLSAQLQVMTENLDSINSSGARDSALAAISSQVALINSLLAYSDYLTQLLKTLRGRFVGEHIQQLPLAETITKINREVELVNSLNVKASESMKRFDEIVAGKN